MIICISNSTLDGRLAYALHEMQLQLFLGLLASFLLQVQWRGSISSFNLGVCVFGCTDRYLLPRPLTFFFDTKDGMTKIV